MALTDTEFKQLEQSILAGSDTGLTDVNDFVGLLDQLVEFATDADLVTAKTPLKMMTVLEQPVIAACSRAYNHLVERLKTSHPHIALTRADDIHFSRKVVVVSITASVAASPAA